MCDFTFEKVKPSSMEHLRKMQLNELKGPVQDSIEEGIITYKADFVRILKENELIGYACIGTYEYYKDIVLDYFIISKCRSNAGAIIELLARHYKCKEWFVNTHNFFVMPPKITHYLIIPSLLFRRQHGRCSQLANVPKKMELKKSKIFGSEFILNGSRLLGMNTPMDLNLRCTSIRAMVSL
jgi:hypothetical protein